MIGLTDRELGLAAASDGMTVSLITQLYGLIHLLESRPQLPVQPFGCTNVQVDAESVAEVDAVAADLGVTAEWNTDRTHYSAVYKVGREVSYRAVFIKSAHMAAYREHMAAFQPEAEVAAA